MPKKIRQLKQALRRAGFSELSKRGKGSHSMWRHERYKDLTVELSGKDGTDARRYHEENTAAAIAEAERRDEEQQ